MPMNVFGPVQNAALRINGSVFKSSRQFFHIFHIPAYQYYHEERKKSVSGLLKFQKFSNHLPVPGIVNDGVQRFQRAFFGYRVFIETKSCSMFFQVSSVYFLVTKYRHRDDRDAFVNCFVGAAQSAVANECSDIFMGCEKSNSFCGKKSVHVSTSRSGFW